VAGISSAAGGTRAEAHAHLEASVPRDGSHVAAAPASVTLQFSEPARLTALWIEKAGGERQRLTRLSPRTDTNVTVALPRLTPGDYLISWRAVGADGHVVPGKVRFTLDR
jgi:methionine-rich copper-binding protein CopC